MIDIKKVLSEHNIYYVTHGPNTKKGNISIKCPLCGPDDPSEHCGIRLSDGYWGCFRNEKHRGKNLYKLLAILDIYVTEERSSIIAALANRTFFNEELSQEIKKDVKLVSTKLPRTFVGLDDSVLSKPYLTYLSTRGFDNPTRVANEYYLARDYSGGKWSNRLIIPIYVNDSVCWTGRAINDNPYRYLSPDETESINIKDCIFNYNELLLGGQNLLIGEGPFDALKADWFLKPESRATCVFGLSMSTKQIDLLKQICLKFNNIYICLDQGTLPQALLLGKHLRNFNPQIIKLPQKDLGDCSKEELESIVKYMKNN